MVRINNNLTFKSNNVIKNDAENSEASKTPKLASNKPALDSIQIKNKKPSKNNNDLTWILGAIGAGIAVAIAVRMHKTPFKPYESTTSKNSTSFTDSYISGTRHSSSSTHSQSKSNDNIFNNFRRENNLNENLINDFKEGFKNTIENKSLEDLKKGLRNWNKNITNFDRPSKIVEEHFNDWTANYDEDNFVNMYAFLKKQQLHIKDPIEAEKSRHSGIFILGRLRENILYTHKNATVEIGKLNFIDNQIGKEVDGLLDYHFGTNKNNVTIPEEIKDSIKLNAKFVGPTVAPYQGFCINMNDAVDQVLGEIVEKHLINNTLTTTGKKLLEMAEHINKKSIEISDKMGETNLFTELKLGSTNKTINNFKNGKFKSGRNEFWDDYFNKKTNGSNNRNSSQNNGKSYQSNNSQGKSRNEKSHESSNSQGSSNNNNYKKYYTEEDKQKESMNIFKQYGEDLGDINTLKEDALKKAYRKLAMQHHPDKNTGDKSAHERFTTIANAYETLLNKINK